MKYLIVLFLFALPIEAVQKRATVYEYENGYIACIFEDPNVDFGLCGPVPRSILRYCDMTDHMNPKCSESI